MKMSSSARSISPSYIKIFMLGGERTFEDLARNLLAGTMNIAEIKAANQAGTILGEDKYDEWDPF